ncbi:MAG: alpha-amylase family glycosyl hydrolase, partial [Pseudomonadota bacterium]
MTARIEPSAVGDAFGHGPLVTAEGVTFRVWAPDCRELRLELGAPVERSLPMQRGDHCFWQLRVPACDAGTRYAFRVDGAGPFPDPASRSQPDGVHAASEVVDTGAFAWRTPPWPGLRMPGLVIYECHVGTATAGGTFEALIADLPRLARLGVNALELLPVAAFPGRRNWGYDGVQWYAPSANYGGPAGLQRLVDAAHGHGLGVLLDVVYNHLGPDGN